MEGKVRVNYDGQTGDVVPGSIPNNDYLYRTSLVKDPEWDIGDRVVLADGREFIYSRSISALHAAHGCEFTYTGLVSYTAFATNHAVGVSEITVPVAVHAALAKDELRGGYVIIFDGDADAETCTRQIIGNDISAANVAFNIRLDASLTNAIVSGTEAIEVYRNPYAALTDGANAAMPKAGLPATGVSATLMYFWVIKTGICWASPQGTVNNNEGVGVMWRHDGSLEAVATALTATVPDADGTQYAGHLVAGSQSGNGPLLMLK